MHKLWRPARRGYGTNCRIQIPSARLFKIKSCGRMTEVWQRLRMRSSTEKPDRHLADRLSTTFKIKSSVSLPLDSPCQQAETLAMSWKPPAGLHQQTFLHAWPTSVLLLKPTQSLRHTLPDSRQVSFSGLTLSWRRQQTLEQAKISVGPTE